MNPLEPPRRFFFVTHPNVVIDRAIPVPRWPLSARGRERMRAGLDLPWVRDVGAVYCRTEQKAIDGAAILAAHVGVVHHVHDALNENDRSSTGFLPPREFERMADAFFANLTTSVRDSERAVDAQQRIVSAVQAIDRGEAAAGTIAIVSHGAVGTLLQCWLGGDAITRRWDQPQNGGGNWFAFTLEPPGLLSRWQAIDADAAAASTRGSDAR